MAMCLSDGSRAINASENMSVFALHFHRVFDNHGSTDPTLLEHITQQWTLWELNDPISWEEFSKAVKKLKNAKAAGLTRVLPKSIQSHVCLQLVTCLQTYQ